MAIDAARQISPQGLATLEAERRELGRLGHVERMTGGNLLNGRGRSLGHLALRLGGIIRSSIAIPKS